MTDNVLSITQTDEVQAIIQTLEAQLEAERNLADEYNAKAAVHNENVRRFSRAIASLKGEPLTPQGAKARERAENGNGRTGKNPDNRARGTVIGEARVEELWRTILDYVETHDTDEFRPIDIRTRLGWNSGAVSAGFKVLREDNRIRLARSQGNAKYFRLTREQVNAPQAVAGDLTEGGHDGA